MRVSQLGSFSYARRFQSVSKLFWLGRRASRLVGCSGRTGLKGRTCRMKSFPNYPVIITGTCETTYRCNPALPCAVGAAFWGCRGSSIESRGLSCNTWFDVELMARFIRIIIWSYGAWFGISITFKFESIPCLTLVVNRFEWNHHLFFLDTEQKFYNNSTSTIALG